MENEYIEEESVDTNQINVLAQFAWFLIFHGREAGYLEQNAGNACKSYKAPIFQFEALKGLNAHLGLTSEYYD